MLLVGSSSPKATTKIAEYLKMKQPEYVESSELQCYLNEPLIQRYDNDDYGDFDCVLAWWKAQECRFPVLAAMARDVLTVHASTVTPEEILSTGRRVLEKEKCSLGPTILEATVCLRDWYLARERLHDQDEKDKLEYDMSMMKLGDDEEEEEEEDEKDEEGKNKTLA